MAWTLPLLLLASLARPVKDAPLVYAGPVWEAWQTRKSLVIRTHEGKLRREVVLPRGFLFELVLGNGTVVCLPRHRKFATLLHADGSRTDKAPFIWRKPTLVRAAYRDGLVVQTENEGKGHLFFVAWKGDKRVRLTTKEALLHPPPLLFRRDNIFASAGWTYDMLTRERLALETPASAEFLFDGKRFVEHDRDFLKGFLLHDGTVYSLATGDGIHLVANGKKRVADFRVPEGGIRKTVAGRNTISFRPDERGWRHVYWYGSTIRSWDGKNWSPVKQADRKSQ